MSSDRVPTISIRYAIPVVFAILIIVTVGVIGRLAFHSGQQAIDDLATQLCWETTARIEEHVNAYMATPQLFHQINVAGIRSGNLDLADLTGLELYLSDQVRITEAVPFVYFGNEQGGFFGIERKKDGTMVLWVLEKTVDPNLNVYILDDAHSRTSQVDSVEFDPRVRPWYTAAVEAQGPAWSTVYPDISRPILVITSAMPVYDAQDNLLGVLGIELSLEQIADFLREMEIGQTGRAFIIERSGNIIASSADESPTITAEDGQERLNVVESSEPLIQAAGKSLQESFGGFETIDGAQQHTLSIDGERYFVQVEPLRDEYGLEWLIVVVIPQADFMQPIYANVRSTIILGSLILLLATLAGFVIAGWIIRPILAVTDAAAAVEAERFVPESLAPVARRTDELGKLAYVFQRMAQEVRTREQWLKRQLQQLRIEIDSVKSKKQVDEIVETDFFRDLQEKARAVRERKRQIGEANKDRE